MKENKIVISSAMLVLTILVIALVVVNKPAIASSSNEQRAKIVKSIRIHEGDTLWDIASEYYTNDYKTLNEYIIEIKKANGLSSDTIHVGNYIILPHYISI